MFSSNVLSALGSAIIMLIIPKFISVEHYGYYQLYLFYIGYTGVSYLGWCEGMNLREGGQYYDKLDKPLHCTQFWLLGLYEVILFLLLFFGSLLVTSNLDKQFTIGFVCFAGVGMCLRWFITFFAPSYWQGKRVCHYHCFGKNDFRNTVCLCSFARISGF